jgi:hypothetical protein
MQRLFGRLTVEWTVEQNHAVEDSNRRRAGCSASYEPVGKLALDTRSDGPRRQETRHAALFNSHPDGLDRRVCARLRSTSKWEPLGGPGHA